MKIINARDCKNCPFLWEEVSFDDVDCGCYANKDMDTNIWCFLPVFICKIKMYFQNRKEKKYWEGAVKKMEREEKRCGYAEKLSYRCLGYQRSMDDDEPTEMCKICEKHIAFDKDNLD